jgi:hypothetical protein
MVLPLLGGVSAASRHIKISIFGLELKSDAAHEVSTFEARRVDPAGLWTQNLTRVRCSINQHTIDSIEINDENDAI